MQKRTIVAAFAVTTGLIVAGTTGAVAGSLIGSSDIRDNSVRSIDLRDGKAVGTKDLRPGLANRVNQHAQDGADGKDGVANPSAAGAGYDTTWPADGQVHETIETCAEGEYITGGGYSTFGGAGLSPTKDLGGDNTDILITVSAPYVNSDGDYHPISDSDSRFYADRWVVRGVNNGDSPQVVRAWALCAPLPN